MDGLTLIYHEDPSTGLPRLEAPGAALDADDLHSLQLQIHHRYHELIGAATGQVIALSGTSDRHLPKYYRVAVRWQDGQRCPTVALYSVDHKDRGMTETHVAHPGKDESHTSGPSEAAKSEPNGDVPAAFGPPATSWPVGFFSELGELLSGQEINGKRSAVDFVLSDLRAVWKKNPKVLTLLLLAGYLEAADAICRRHGTPLENKYTQAARLLKERFSDLLPEGALDLLLE